MPNAPDGASLKAERARIRELSPGLLPSDTSWRPAKPASDRFAWWETDSALAIVSGVQEKADTELALAYGLGLRGDRRLVLVLPAAHLDATLQRSAFLKRSAAPDVFVHSTPFGGAPSVIEPAPLRSTAQARKRLADFLGSKTPEQELTAAATPKHLGERSAAVRALVEWATEQQTLDPGHRRGERSWHCRGQKVLSISTLAGGALSIVAGIHHTDSAARPKPVIVAKGEPLTDAELKGIRKAVEGAATLRLEDGKRFHKADEHWLQSVIRNNPHLVGVEQPALRELPAWRPGGGKNGWGRGFVDLAGLDGIGDIRIVETKLAKNPDDMLVLQGLDYYVWAQVYRDALRTRLSAAKQAEIRLHYAIGVAPDGVPHVSKYAQAQADALDIPWRAHVITKWFPAPGTTDAPRSEDSPPGRLLP